MNTSMTAGENRESVQRYEQVEEHATRYIEARGVTVRSAPMDVEVPAEFDGLSIVLNSAHDVEARAHYLVHSFGSIVGWSIDLEGVQAIFDELREAKVTAAADPQRLERAIRRFRQFEEGASCYSVWVLDRIGHGWAIEAFDIFFRADLEAMTIYHRTGRAPNWPAFLAEWRGQIDLRERRIVPFEPRAVPVFHPRRFEKQQVKQER